MAAADYYQAGPPLAQHQTSPTSLAPPSQPQRASSQPSYVYPQYQQNSNLQTPPQQFLPPPYHSTTTGRPPNPPYAQNPPQRNSFSYPERPNPQTWSQSYPPPPNSNQQMQYRPQRFTPPHHQAHRPSYSQPYLHPNLSSDSLDSGYLSDPEPRRRRHSHHKKSRSSTRSTTTEGFLGAAGGGLIGDLLFPGLGTVGGALAGWIGGIEYGEHKKRRDSQLEAKQREWEEKFDPDGKRRSGEHDRSRASRRSHDSGRH
jgi:hypothetical protein